MADMGSIKKHFQRIAWIANWFQIIATTLFILIWYCLKTWTAFNPGSAGIYLIHILFTVFGLIVLLFGFLALLVLTFVAAPWKSKITKLSDLSMFFPLIGCIIMISLFYISTPHYARYINNNYMKSHIKTYENQIEIIQKDTANWEWDRVQWYKCFQGTNKTGQYIAAYKQDLVEGTAPFRVEFSDYLYVEDDSRLSVEDKEDYEALTIPHWYQKKQFPLF